MKQRTSLRPVRRHRRHLVRRQPIDAAMAAELAVIVDHHRAQAGTQHEGVDAPAAGSHRKAPISA